MYAYFVLESSKLWPAAVAGLAVLTAAAIWAYPAQLRGGGLLGWLPLGLRWMALAALALTILRPVLMEPNSSLQSGGVIVLVDCSKSMGVTDRGRSPAERVAVAAALGALPKDARTDQGATVAENIRRAQTLARNVLSAQSDLDYARVSGRGFSEKRAGLQTAVARYAEAVKTMLDSTRSLAPGTELRGRLASMGQVPSAEAREAWSMLAAQFKPLIELAQSLQVAADEQLYNSDPQVRQRCESIANLSRLSLVHETLLGPRAGLIGHLLPKGRVEGYAIGSELQPLALSGGREAERQIPWRAAAPRSDLTGAVAAAQELASRHPVKAIVLFSDGRQVGGRGDLTSAVRPSGVPVFTVDVSTQKVPDVWFYTVSPVSASAFAGETIEGQAEIRCRDVAHLPDKLAISGAQGRQEVALTPRPGRGRGAVVELTARYSMPVGPSGSSPSDQLVFTIPTQPDEVTDQNNRVERWVKVVTEQVRVLLCVGDPTWDSQYLRGALSGRPWIRLEVASLDQQRPRLQVTAAQLLQQDVIILNDVPVGAMDVTQWDAVSRLAGDRGGSVIVIAGANNAPADYPNQPIAGGLLPFHDVRPTWKEWPGEQGAFHFVPTRLGEVELFREANEPQRRWQELPGLYRYLQIPERGLFPDVRKLLVETESGSAVLTERIRGDGRVFFVGLDETWRWRRAGSSREPDRFWRQLIRHAAGEPYAAQTGPIALDATRIACEPGEVVKVRARVRGGLAAANASSYPLEIVLRGKSVDTVMLNSTGRGRFEGELRDLQEGDYQLQLRGTGRSARTVVSVPLHVAAGDEAELRDVSGDFQQLSRIARSSGGEYFSLENVDRLPNRLAGLHGIESQLVRRSLYSNPLLFVFVLACLAGEWALRKRHGLS
jgi:hypothetical protein